MRVRDTLVAAACTAFATSPLAQTGGAPPIAAYARLPAVEDVVVSPDGARVAYVQTQGDNRTVRIRTFAGQALAALDAGVLPVRFLDWAGPEQVLIVTRRPVGPFTTVAGTIPRQEMNIAAGYDLSTRKAVRMLSNVSGLTGAINSNPRRIVHEGRPAIVVTALNIGKDGGGFEYAPYRVDPRTGRGVQVDDGSLEVTQWLSRPDGELAARAIRRSNGDWVLQIRRGGGWSDLVRTPRSVPTPFLSGFGRDGRTLLVSGGPDGRSGLYEITPETGAWSAPLADALFAPPTYFDRGGDGRLLAAIGSAGETAPIIYDPALRTSWAVAARSFPNKQLRLIDTADDRRTLVLGVAEPGGPEAAYVLDLDAKRADLVGEEYPDLPAEAAAQVRELSFNASDGTKLGAVLTTPPGREPKALPVIVLARGVSGRNEQPRFDWMAQALASRGYGVLQVDSRDAAPGAERAGDGQYGRKLQTDLGDAVRHLASTGLADPGRVCIVGLGGHGGYAALAGVTVQAGPYRCAVAVGARADLRAELRALNQASGGSAEFRYAAALRHLGVSNAGDSRLDAILPARKAAQGRAPVLLLQGSDDVSIPAADARAMHAALRRAGRTAELIVVPGGDAGLTREAARLRVLAETLRFLDAHNPSAG